MYIGRLLRNGGTSALKSKRKRKGADRGRARSKRKTALRRRGRRGAGSAGDDNYSSAEEAEVGDLRVKMHARVDSAGRAVVSAKAVGRRRESMSDEDPDGDDHELSAVTKRFDFSSDEDE